MHKYIFIINVIDIYMPFLFKNEHKITFKIKYLLGFFQSFLLKEKLLIYNIVTIPNKYFQIILNTSQ